MLYCYRLKQPPNHLSGWVCAIYWKIHGQLFSFYFCELCVLNFTTHLNALHGMQNVNKCATQPWFLRWVSLSISLSLFKYMAGAYTCSPQKSWDCTYIRGEFAFIYKCLVECYWDSHWRTHRACIGKHKFTHWVETGLIYWQWAKSDDQALTLLAYKTIVYEAFWSTNILSSPDFRALTLPLRS